MSFIIRTPQMLTNYINNLVDSKVSNITTTIDNKFDSKDNVVLETASNQIPPEKLSSVRYMSLVFDPVLNPEPVVELPELPITQVFYLINQTDITEEQTFFVTINYKDKMIGMLEAEYGIQLLYVKDIDRFFVI